LSMSERVRIQPLTPFEYAAEVHEGQDTTHHKVTLSQGFLDDLEMPDVAGEDVVGETMRYLLDREPGVAIGHDVDLDHLANHDHDYLAELRPRLAGVHPRANG
jgi:hypothetical protein